MNVKNLDAPPSTGAEHLRVLMGEMQEHVVDRKQVERGGTEGPIPPGEVESSTVTNDMIQSPPVELEEGGKLLAPLQKRGLIRKKLDQTHHC